MAPAGGTINVKLRKALARKSKAEAEFRVRLLKTEGELREQWEIDTQEYKDGAAPYEKLAEWWQCYPSGIFVMIREDGEQGASEIVGAVGIFPVSEAWIKDFQAGKVTEQSLTGAVIKEGARESCENWYITGVVLSSKYHKQSHFLLSPMLRESIVQWAIRSNRKHPVTLWSIALSKEGEQLLEKFDFELDRLANQMADNRALYKKVVSQQDISDAIDSLTPDLLLPEDDETQAEEPGRAAARAAARDHLVILVHGINTWAQWMPAVRQHLEDAGFAVAPTNFGNVPVRRFLSKKPESRKAAIEIVEDHIRTARRAFARETGRLPRQMSVISHSFGTYVMCQILIEPEFDWHRVIFCGSVMPNDFPLRRAEKQFVHPLLNHVGTRDYWPVIAASAGWGYGSVGSVGLNDPLVRTRWHKGFRHSDFLTVKFCEENWVPFLLGKDPPQGDSATGLPLWLRTLARMPLRRWKWAAGIAILVGLAVLLYPHIGWVP